MAKVGKNVLTRGLSGMFGRFVVFRSYREKTIMASAPGRQIRPFTEAQLSCQQRFREAVIYAKAVLTDPDRKAEYESAAENGGSAYNLAVSDFMKSPGIHEMDVSK